MPVDTQKKVPFHLNHPDPLNPSNPFGGFSLLGRVSRNIVLA